MSALSERIVIDDKILAGKPVIRGLRISVEQILSMLASGLSSAEILTDYPELDGDDILAAIAYAADLVGEESVYHTELH